MEKQQQTINQKSIFNRLNEVKNLQWSQNDQKKMIKSRNPDKNETRDTDYARPQSLQRQRRPTIDQQYEKKGQPKRFNQITVHEHLYRNSFKLQNKKMINKVIDEEYKKKVVFKFTPTINKKSIILAESKFSRIKQEQMLFPPKDETIQTEATDDNQKETRQVERYKLLNKTFYLLSEGKTILTESSIQNSIMNLPLPCLKVIQSIISRIYQGQQMQWLDFLESFNDKNIKGKEGFYAIMAKWFARNENGSQDRKKEGKISQY